MPKLTVVPQSPPDARETLRQKVVRHPKPAAILQCRCGGREFIATLTGVEHVGGKTRGGTKALICAACYLRGERVVIA